MNKQELSQLLDDKLDHLTQHIKNQPDDLFVTQKVPGKWSNGEHLEHLRKTTRAVNKGMKLPGLVLRLKFGTCNRSERTYDETKKRYTTYLKESKAKSPEEFNPNNITAADKERLLTWFIQEKETMQATVSKLSEKALSQYVIPHPLIGKLTFREFVYFTAFHADHHLALMKRDNS